MSKKTATDNRPNDLFPTEIAGSVLRMIQVALGLEAWNLGIHYYLLSYEFTSVAPEDFYITLQAALDEVFPDDQWDIAAIFQSWEHQSGNTFSLRALKSRKFT